WAVEVDDRHVVHLVASTLKTLGRLARDLTDALGDDAPDSEQKFLDSVRTYARAGEKRSHLSNVASLARGLVRQVQPDDLDSDPWVLACPNGVVDLRTGELLAHDPQRLVTKHASVDFSPDAECPTFDRVLGEIQ